MPKHYEVRSAIHPGKQLTPAQRTSSRFEEAPRIGSIVLRRGKILKLSEAEMYAQHAALKRHLMSGSIELVEVDDEAGTRAKIMQFGAPPASIEKAVQQAVEEGKVEARDDEMLKQEAEKAIEESGDPAVEPEAPVAEEPVQVSETVSEVEAAPEVVQEEVQADTVAEAPKSRKRR